MADQFKNVGEVGYAIHGIREQLSLHKGVFMGAFGLSVIVAGALFTQGLLTASSINDLKVIDSRLEGKIDLILSRLDAIAGDTRQTRASVDEVKAALVTPPPSATEAETELIAKFRQSLGTDFTQTGSGTVQYADIEKMVETLPAAERKDLEIGCLFASDKPAEYSTTVLGACAAVVNAIQR